MGGIVQLRLGDIFDGPSDLLVVPCSTVPTVAGFVAERLRTFRLPSPTRPYHLGEVEIVPLTGAENVAAYIAFAASVQGGGGSSDTAINAIGRTIGAFSAAQPGVRNIAAPLVGAGAGGLSPRLVCDALRSGFLETAPDAAVLNLFILRRELYDDLVQSRLLRAAPAPSPAEPPPPFGIAPTPGMHDLGPGGRTPPGGATAAAPRAPIRVFISYTRTSPEHAQWVKNLAKFLRANGIDARLDAWHLRLGMDVAQWMCNELDQAERVILICNEEYARRADGRHGGVGWEIRLVHGDLLLGQATNPEKYIAVVRTSVAEDGLPGFLKSSYYLHWPPAGSDDGSLQETLLRAIYQKAEEAPPIGQPPAFVL